MLERRGKGLKAVWQIVGEAGLFGFCACFLVWQVVDEG